jgi:single-strand DNA-binding protein
LWSGGSVPGRGRRRKARRSAVEIEADEIGPSLRWATAKVEKTQKSSGGGDWSENVSVGAGGPSEETPLE